MATIEQFEQHYHTAPKGQKNLFCMDDRFTNDPRVGLAHVQTAASALGLGFDTGLMRTATGHEGMLYIPDFTLRIMKALGGSIACIPT